MNFLITLAAKHILSNDQEFIFIFEYCNIILYVYLINANFIFMHAVNLSDKLIKILLKVRLDFLTDFNKMKVYLAEFKAVKLAHIDQDNLSHFNQDNLSHRLVNSTHFETILLNNITVYSNKEIVRTLSKIINHHDIWINHEEFVKVFEKEWIFISLKKMRKYDCKYKVRKNLFSKSWQAEKSQQDFQ